MQPQPNFVRIQRRRALLSLFTQRLPFLRLALFLIGYLWIVALPYPKLARPTYIDENALLPGQVNTHWHWPEVHHADRYLAQLELLRDTNASTHQRAQFLKTQFLQLGIPAATQNYQFALTLQALNGTNVYAVLSSPRASGAEAIVISASWITRANEADLNLRGVATVLSLAKYLNQYSLWAKDLIFVISDGYMDGMQAWLTSYHGSTQDNLKTDRLQIPSGVIWTALNIDYPGHSFSHLGIFHEGLNGRLPNQDLLNSFNRISNRSGVPVAVYDHLDPRDLPARRDELEVIPPWVPTIIRDNSHVRAYAHQARNVLRHVKYQGRGRASGVHGLFHQFRIDAFTIYALPASGPHGFHAIGRVIESTLRTSNNLLERLHASFFFYILTGPARFMKIGSFLPSAILISVAMMSGGLKEWVDAAWISELNTNEKTGVKWIQRKRPVLVPLAIIISTHLVGTLAFFIGTTEVFVQNAVVTTPLLFALLSTLPLSVLLVPPRQDAASLSSVLKALNLCFASTVISITTVLNFSLAASLAILLGLPLSFSSPSASVPTRAVRYVAYLLLGFGWLLWEAEVRKAVWDWEVLGVWFAPFVCIVYGPLVLQAATVCLLPP